MDETKPKPEILAPAGSKPSFLAALAAGADAVYCGLKLFSARMEADNFTLAELASLTDSAHSQGTKVFLALNTLLRPDELAVAGGLVRQAWRWIRPDALIIQDLSLMPIARQAGYDGPFHLSTLANLSMPSALRLMQDGPLTGIGRIVLPRELNIDEIKNMASCCPDSVGLEVFIHGALCYSVSGRCYWSSFMGGKSGLRGRCVQPCRRRYTLPDGQKARIFSCQDLSLDVLVKVLSQIPQIRVWKIEGRKKGPHYVYYVVQAYRMLRDHFGEPESKKSALMLLERALGRPGTHYYFLPQRPQAPVQPRSHTGSGMMMGWVKGAAGNRYLSPREELLPGDLIRIGYEDDAWHRLIRVGKSVPKHGKYFLKLPKAGAQSSRVPAFLVDRKERALEQMLEQQDQRLKAVPSDAISDQPLHLKFGKSTQKPGRTLQMTLFRHIPRQGPEGGAGVWLTPANLDAAGRKGISKIWWWLPPVIWPAEEATWRELVQGVRQAGGRSFVLNAPWQIVLFDGVKEGCRIWAGPFCNIANPLAAEMLKQLGFYGVIVSPELGETDFLGFPRLSPLPLGIVIQGMWPLGIARGVCPPIDENVSFSSPKKEEGWMRRYGENLWLYPNWRIDLTSRQSMLEKAGYRLFVRITEPIPNGIQIKKRPGLWNWDLNLA